MMRLSHPCDDINNSSNTPRLAGLQDVVNRAVVSDNPCVTVLMTRLSHPLASVSKVSNTPSSDGIHDVPKVYVVSIDEKEIVRATILSQPDVVASVS